VSAALHGPPAPLAVYARGLALAGRGGAGGGELRLVGADGQIEVQDVARWVGVADAVDARVVRRCAGPTLDLGCGPGRLTVELASRGVRALGVDVSPYAVAAARRRGAVVIEGDVFGPLPGEGGWGSALLADGNVGIGGDPERLMLRVAALVRPGGRAVVEVSPRDVDLRGGVRIALAAGPASTPFPWATLGAPALRRVAAVTGWAPADQWDDGGRRFVVLLRGRRQGAAAGPPP